MIAGSRPPGELSMAVAKSLWTAMLSSILWHAGALFAVSLALLVSGATVLVMMCLLMLADLTENWGGDAFGQVLLHRAGIGQTMKREFWPNSNANLRRMPDTFLHGPKLSDVHSADDRANDQIVMGTRSPRS
jgi:hypothetical protein